MAREWIRTDHLPHVGKPACCLTLALVFSLAKGAAGQDVTARVASARHSTQSSLRSSRSSNIALWVEIVAACAGGPASPVVTYCNMADLDSDGDVDLVDMGMLMRYGTTGMLYWGNNYTAVFGYQGMWRGAVDGGGQTRIQGPVFLPDARALAIDACTGDIFWKSDFLFYRAASDGSGRTLLSPEDCSCDKSLAIDAWSHRLIWCRNTSLPDGGLNSSDFDGTNHHILITGRDSPYAVDVDNVNQWIYWLEGGDPFSKHVIRARLDGSAAEDLFGELDAHLADLVVDPLHQTIYWTEADDGRIWQGNLATRAFAPILSGIGNPYEITIDLQAQKIYWFDNSTLFIWRSGLDGSNPESVITAPIRDPAALAISANRLVGRDCDGNGILDQCEPYGDCNGNTVADNCDVAYGTSVDCQSNGIPDECEPDCNSNGIADECDVLTESSLDINSNIVPDECETDCNSNSIPDGFEIASGSAPDCNSNGRLDSCDIGEGASNDADTDGVPDECDQDCNHNGRLDFIEIAQGSAADCNSNSVPDSCDVGLAYVFWSNESPSEIARAKLNGSMKTTIQSGFKPDGVAIDRSARKLYWIAPNNKTIRRCDYDGANTEIVATSVQLASDADIALIPNIRTLFFTVYSSGAIYRVDIDTGVVQLFKNGLGDVRGIATDVMHGYVFWIESSARKIGRINIDGTGLVYIIATPTALCAGLPEGGRDLDVDEANSQLYWLCPGYPNSGVIRRSGLDGSNQATVLSSLGGPESISVNLPLGKMYWIEGTTSKIRRANLDGSLPQDVFVSPTSALHRVTTLYEPGSSPDVNQNEIPDECDSGG